MAQTRIAVVTGASGGIGSELCRRLAARGVGLVLLDRDAKKSAAFAAELNRAFPASVRETISVDLASHSDLKRVAEHLRATYPAIHLLFNNAGVLTETLQFSPHGNELHFEVNTLAPLALIDGLRPALRAAEGAAIVNTSAGISLQVKELRFEELVRPSAPFKKLFGPYIASKAALNVLTAALVEELARDSILIRAADPGPTKSALTRGAGTPFWMRLFYACLPSAATNAKKIFDAALPATYKNASGVFVSGGKVQALPPALRDVRFEAALLRLCRERAALA